MRDISITDGCKCAGEWSSPSLKFTGIRGRVWILTLTPVWWEMLFWTWLIIRLCGSLSAPSCFPQWNPIAYLSTALSCKPPPSTQQCTGEQPCQTNCTERLGRRQRATRTNSLVPNLKTNNANTEQAKRTLTSQQWENVCVSILHRASAWNPGQHPDLKFISESEYAGKRCLFIFWRGYVRLVLMGSTKVYSGTAGEAALGLLLM